VSDRARWEHFHHVADVGVRGVGATREEAFVQAAVALTAVTADPAAVRPEQVVDIVAEGEDDESLLLAWLDAIIYEMAVRHMLFGRYELDIRGTRAVGRAWGETVDAARHEPAVEIKAATYAELTVTQRPDGAWVAQCVVDV
jgi:tRNA nucleotidyltransferase (CCA-adding enzyme)